MTDAQIDEGTERTKLRLWPGVIIVVLQWLVWLGLPVVAPDAAAFAAIGALVGGVLLVLWWLLFSRARWGERFGAVIVMVVALVLTRQLLHESMATAGMGVLFFVYSVPVLSLVFVGWAILSESILSETILGGRLSDGRRRLMMVAAIVLACLGFTLVRMDGVRGGSGSDFAWRWSQTPEERLLAQAADALPLPPPAATAGVEADWPGFRGHDRDSVVRGIRIATDWAQSPPVELWRRPIGPGWSSFAVGGDYFYTQEQRGEDEIVACYAIDTGEPVWMHEDPARFWEANAGAGPRATPTLRDGRLYTFGATGILNVLDAGSGAVLWSRDATTDTGAEIPGWGFSSSPLVVDDVVMVYADALVAYDLERGEPRWVGPSSDSYSSPHLVTIDGVAQILMLSGAGAVSVAVADGTELWQHPWPGGIVQPAFTADGDLLLSGGGLAGGSGIRRIEVVHDPTTQGSDAWTTKERWTSNRLKPNFNDFVVHEGQAYGFDGSILASIDLETGERNWKGGRYGNGQLLLLVDQSLLLVLSEKGELALVRAARDEFTELARFPAIEGKTWNHPVLVGDLLLVRNGEEMAAFKLALAAS